MPLASLQYLRGIAAFMVICVHLRTQVERMGYAGGWPDWTAAGVDIFFVLSGFLMWSTTVGRDQPPLEFYRRRIVRIVPLYWLLTSVVVAVMVVAPQALQSVRFDWLNVIGSYLFFFTPGSSGRLEPVLVVGWTLNYEMLFYVIYGAALALPAGWRFGTTVGVIVALVCFGATTWADADPVLQRYTASIMVEFALGMVIARCWQRLPAGRAGTGLGVLLTVAGFAGLALLWDVPTPNWRGLSCGVPAAMIVTGALLLERAGSLPHLPGMQRLGDMSYSLYLSHPIVLSAFAQVWRKLGLHLLPGGWWLFCLAASAVCIAFAAVLYRWVESPLNRRLVARTGAPMDRRANH